MTDKLEALVLTLSADFTKLSNQIKKAQGDTGRGLKSIEDRFAQSASKIDRQAQAMARNLGVALATIGVGVAIREVSQYADAWTEAGNKLAAAGIAQGKLAGTLDDLVGLARATRSEFGATVDLYAGLTRATQSLGLAQAEVRQITETTLKAFQAGGASASEAASGILQLKQALGSGVLQGDELRSIRENAPVLAQAIADEFGVTIAQLKKLGEQGELTSGRVAKAILNAKGINEQFARTNATVATSITNLQTAFTRYIGTSNTAGTATRALGGFINYVADNLDTLVDATLIAAATFGTTLAAQALPRVIAGLTAMRAAMMTTAGAATVLRTAMAFFGGPVGAAIIALGAAFAFVGLKAATSSASVDDLRQSLADYADVSQKLKDDTDALAEANRKLNDAIAAGGEAAKSAAILEVEAIRKRIGANEELRKVYLAESRAKLAQLERSGGKAEDGRTFEDIQRDARNTIRKDPQFTSIGVNFGFESQDWRRLAQDQLIKKAQELDKTGGTLSEKDANLLRDLALLKKRVIEIEQLRASVEALENTAPSNPLSLPQLLGLPAEISAGGVSSGGTSIGGFQTDVEKLTQSLKALTDARERDLEAQSVAKFNLSTVLLSSSTAGTGKAAADQLKQVQDALVAANKAVSDNDPVRSRAAVEALLDYAKATNDVAGAVAKIKPLGDVLSADDVKLVTAELRKLAEEGAAAASTGFTKLAIEHKAAVDAIAQAEANDMALNVDNHAAYYEALLEEDRKYAQAKADLWNEVFRGEQAVPNVPPAGQPKPREQSSAEIAAAKAEFARRQGLTDAADGFDRDAEIARKTAELAARGWTEDDPRQIAEDLISASEHFRDSLRDSVKSAFREGIETGDWGDAFKSIIANALSNVLDGGLNNIADGITNFLTGKRAGGGPVSAGGTYLVGERGPELLSMGNSSGHIFNSEQINRQLSAGGGRGGSIYAPLIVQGSIDSVTWPKVEAAMRARDAQWARRLPTAIDARVSDGMSRRRF